MRKQALLAMMLALVLVLTGCTLVQKDPEVDAATEIIRLGDQVVTKGEIQEQVDQQLNYMSALYSMYGYSFDPTSEQAIADARDSVVNAFKEDLASKAKISELGLDQLTAEEEEKAKTQAEETYQSRLNSILSSDFADSELSEEEKNAQAKAKLEKEYSMDQALTDAKETIASDKLRAETIKDVTVTEEEIQAEYDSRVASAKETYENSAGTWASAANSGSTLYYTPAGVRYVKQILVKFLAEDRTKIDEANQKVTDANGKVTAADSKVSDAQAVLDDENASEEAKATAKTDLEAAQSELEAAKKELEAAQAAAKETLDAAFANIDAAADEIQTELANGADWDTLMADKTEDPGMQSGITAERGYAVSADMTSFDSAFVQAAMALEKVGDVSAKTRGETHGYYIIKYVGDAVEGPIALDEVKDSLQESLLSTKQDSTYADALKSWVEAAGFKVDMNALKN